MQTIWIINQYATCPSRGTACRHFMISRELVKQGYQVTIISGSGHHFHHKPPKKLGCNNIETVEGVNFLWVKTPKYKQSQQLVRGLAWLVFSLRLFFIRCKSIEKPNVIYYSSPSLIPFLAGYFLSWRNKAKILFEFRDVWPMTFTEIAKYSRFHPVVFLQAWIETFALKNSNACISSMEFGSRRLKELGLPVDNFCWLPNGVSIEDFNVSQHEHKNIKHRKVVSSKRFVFGYIGTHGKANALDVIIDAASYLVDDPIEIVFVGDGAEKARLTQRAQSLSLKNITFLDAIAKEKVSCIMREMDAFLISWHDVGIYRYGTSSNKLAEYFAAGKPIVQAYSGKGDHIQKYKAGLTVPAGDARALSEAMKKIANAGEVELQLFAKNARQAADAHFRFESIANKFIKLLNTMN